MKLIDTLLRKENIDRGDGNLYLERWTLLRFSADFWLWKLLGLADRRVYLHKFVGSDCADLHNHPNNFVSIMIKGGYIETVYDPKTKKEVVSQVWAPKIRFLKANHTHRIESIKDHPAWTIVIMSPKKNPWGFFIYEGLKRKFIDWKEYLTKKMHSGGCD